MRRQTQARSFSFGWLLIITLLALAVLFGGAWWLGGYLAGNDRQRVREPSELYYPIQPYIAPSSEAALVPDESTAVEDELGGLPQQTAPAESTPPGVSWPPLSEQRRQNLSSTTVGWGQGVEKNDKNQPVGALDGMAKYGDLGAYFIFPEAENTLYLTYDLGYENGYTAPILDALREKGAHGVFFVTMDYVKSAPELVQRIIDEGHILGNHSVHHPSMPDCTEAKATAEVMELHEYVKEHFGGYEMTLFRFPRGEFSEKTLVLLRDLGYTSVFWSYAYVDWNTDDQPDVAQSLAKLTAAAHPGAIYLLHTVSATNAALMGDLIDALRQAGYTIGEMPH